MAIKVAVPEGKAALTEFIQFYDQVYAYRDARWPAALEVQLPILIGDSPFLQDREICPFVASAGSNVLARAVAVVDARYNRQWKEHLGHIVMFEAMPDTGSATKVLIDTACDWLRDKGAKAARAGFGLQDSPFVIDDYESLPPVFARQNPHYYHRLLKEASFESEKGWVDYKIEVKPELVDRWKDFLETARSAGYEIVPLKDLSEKQRLRDFATTWKETFKRHWGFTPFLDDEVSVFFELFGPAGMFDTSVIAYRYGAPVGVLFVVPEVTAKAALNRGRALKDSEKLNTLAIGVRESARGHGVNLAMTAYAYLEMARRGAKYLSYTLVLDDNWPSRRTAEKLGAFVCANYIVYRRNFHR
ncbi:MAG TPA: hypothetical protein VGK99_07345 [Acidobacteriota bacterium]|jgi:GNAT superfamily N-acetyltransferase